MGGGGVTPARPFVVRKWPGGWGGSPPGGRPILVTFNGDFPCSSLLFYAFLCFSMLFGRRESGQPLMRPISNAKECRSVGSLAALRPTLWVEIPFASRIREFFHDEKSKNLKK